MKGTRIRILHLEDNPRDAEMILHNLESEDMEVSILRVDEKGAFVDALRAGGFDLILSDYSLPAFNGSAALDLAKEILPEVPFIFVSGRMGEDLGVESLKQGAVDYVLKGFLSRLAPAVERALKDAEARKAKLLAELELSKTKDRLAMIIENSKDSIWSIDSDFRLMTFNSIAAQRIRAVTGAEIRPGMRVDQLIQSEDGPKWMGWFKRAMAGEDFQAEISYDRPGAEIYVELSINPIRTGDAVTGMAIFSRDVTERKRAEREVLKQRDELERVNARLLENQAQLIQSEKLASLGQLSAGVAHEINNPMAFVTSNLRTLADYAGTIQAVAAGYGGFLEMLRENPGAAAGEAKDALEKLLREKKYQSILEDLDCIIAESLDGAQRVNEIVQSLKNMARVDDAILQPTDVNQCLHDALKLAWNELKYKCTIEKKMGALPMVQGHPGQLKQVFINMLVNAAQAIPEKGVISIRTAPEKGKITIEIEDNGSGISEENLPKLFTPFFTTKPVGKGTGLGLPISYGIIQNHHGEMEVRSLAGRGTTFIITLPVQDWTPSAAE